MASLTISGCEGSSSPITTPSRETPTPTVYPGAPRRPDMASEVTRSLSEWQRLSARERLDRLEKKQHPLIVGFNEQKELSLAVAQLYCEQALCDRPAEELAQNIFIVNASEAVHEYEQELGRTLSDAERLRAMRDFLLISTRAKKSFLNNDAFEERTRLFSNNPIIARDLEGRDFKTVARKSLMIHGIAQMNRSSEIAPVRLVVQIGERVLTIDRIEELSLNGEASDGSPYALKTVGDAMAEYVAREVLARQRSSYVSLTPALVDASELVRRLNEKTHIPFSEFVEYYTGKQSVQELVDKWGSLNKSDVPSSEAALFAMFIIGVRGAGQFSSEAARSSIEQAFNQRLFER